MRTSAPQVIDCDFRDDLDEFLPKKLYERFLKEYSALSNIVLFEDFVADNLNLVDEDFNFGAEEPPALLFLVDGREKQKDHHGKAFVSHEPCWQLQLNHILPDFVSHHFRLPIVACFQEAKCLHVLSQEVAELAQQGFVQGVFLNLLRIDSLYLDLLRFEYFHSFFLCGVWNLLPVPVNILIVFHHDLV